MDKFFYRLTVQTIWKAIVTILLTFLCVGVLYTVFISVLQPVSATVDYWLHTGLTVAVTAICSFFIIIVKDDYSTSDVTPYAVGKFWSERIYKNKKMGWFTMELIMLPLLAFAVLFGYLAYLGHSSVLLVYGEVFAVEQVSQSDAIGLLIDQGMHYIEQILAIFLLFQWRHVRGFAKKGRCPKCKAAFSIGYHRSGEVTTATSSKISKKGRAAVVGEAYQVKTQGDKEVERAKVADLYGTVYDFYQTDTKTTSYQRVCTCAFCKEIFFNYDYSSSSTTKKI